nr:transcription factor APG-like [Aegilops tauschii subsp. strangulata]
MDGRDPAATGPWWYPDDCPAPGEVAAVAGAAGGDDDEFLDIEYLLGMGWEAGAPVSCARSSPPRAPPEPPPSDDVMATWLYPIVSGDENAGDGPMVRNEPSAMAAETKGKLPATEGVADVKRRRCKISDRLRTLQQLVPGCDKTNQESTLDQTIKYMKSLQQQVQAMIMRQAPAVYPTMHTASAPAVMVPPGAGGPVPLLPAEMAPFGAMLPCPPSPYHAVMAPAPAPPPPLYPPQPAASAAPDPGAASMEQHYNRGKGRRRRL